MKKEKKKGNGKGWIVLLVILSVIAFAVLELGKHTIPGWALTAVLIAGFAVLRSTKLKGKKGGLRFLCWIAAIAVFAVILLVSWPPFRAVPAVDAKNPEKTAVYHVSQGDLTGVKTEDGAVEVFAGIPYAKPPVGDLRWKEPVPAGPWEGVLAADHFAPMSMQTRDLPIYSSLSRIIGFHDYKISLKDNFQEPVSEDSLYLNIWKPAGDAKGLPVMVYVHGGSLQTGQPSYADYSGKGLAEKGVIVVNMGYRLGVFGFFASEELAAESPNGTTGNYGLLDQIEALKWVRDNIAVFGGDPDNVTISGESAGSACVTALCTSPLANGLFKKVLAESSTVTAPKPAHSFRLLDDAFKAGKKTMEKFGASSIADLRAVPAEKIVGELNTHHHITVDGYVLEETPYESYAAGRHNEEAQLHGFNRLEATPFILFSQANLKNYESKIRGYFKERADRVLELYPAKTDKEAKDNWADIYSAVLFTYGHYCWARQAEANGIDTYNYFFTKDNGYLGTWHSGEEVYFYGNIPEGSKLFTVADRELSKTITSYVISFMKTGDPNSEGLPNWPKGGAKTVQELGERTGQTEDIFLPLYDILDEMNGWK